MKLIGFDMHNRWVVDRLSHDRDIEREAYFESELVIVKSCPNGDFKRSEVRMLEVAWSQGCEVCFEKRLLKEGMQVCRTCVDMCAGESSGDSSGDEFEPESSKGCGIKPTSTVHSPSSLLTRSTRKNLLKAPLREINITTTPRWGEEPKIKSEPRIYKWPTASTTLNVRTTVPTVPLVRTTVPTVPPVQTTVPVQGIPLVQNAPPRSVGKKVECISLISDDEDDTPRMCFDAPPAKVPRGPTSSRVRAGNVIDLTI